MASEPKVGEVQRRDDGCYVYVGAFPMREWVRCSTPAALSLSAELSAAREMREVLREVEWSVGYESSGDRFWCCPTCNNEKPAHAPDCRLARLIGGGE